MNKQPLVSGISQVIEVPCKNQNLSLAQRKLLENTDENFRVRVDKIGSFYYPKDPTWPMFQDCHFERNYEYDWVFMTDAPLKLFFEITRVCNLKCKGCYIPNMIWDSINMNQIQKIVDDASACQVLSIQLLWGEPTLHADFIDICRYIKSKGISVETVTNGVRITKDYAERLRWLISYIGISIDWLEKTHNSFRGSNKSYEKAVNAFYYLNEVGINTEILMTVNRLNIWDIDGVFNVAWKDNRRFYLKVMHMADSMTEEMKEICLSKEEVVELKKKADALWIWIQAPVADFNLTGESSFFGCPGWVITGIIDTSGYVYKCLYLRDKWEILWNVFSEGLQEIWKRTRARIEEIQWPKCVSCSMRSSCWWLCTLCKTKNRYY